MAQKMMDEDDLPTLRVRLGGEGRERLTAVFEAARGRGPVQPITEVSTSSIGLSDRIQSARDVAESRFVLPRGLVDALVAALRGLAAADAPAYWLDLPSPRGYLPLVPWERLLSPALGRPLLRLPISGLRPNAPGMTVRVVLVAGQAVGVPAFDVAPLVADLVDAWTESGRCSSTSSSTPRATPRSGTGWPGVPLSPSTTRAWRSTSGGSPQSDGARTTRPGRTPGSNGQVPRWTERPPTSSISSGRATSRATGEPWPCPPRRRPPVASGRAVSSGPRSCAGR